MAGRWWRRPLPALVAVALLLPVACSGTAADAERSRRMADPVRALRVLMADDWVVAPAVVDAVRDFEADHPGVQVVLRGAPFSQIPQLARSAARSGQPYDVVHGHAFALAAAGDVQPLGERWEDAGITAAEWLDGAVEDVTWQGEVYGLPLDTNALVLLVNRDLLDAAGVPIGSLGTFEGFAAAAAAVTDGERTGYAMTASIWRAYGWVRAFGGDLVDEDLDVTLDAPEVVTAMSSLAGMVRAGTALPPSARDVSTDATTLFQSGMVAMHATGSWDVAQLARAEVPFRYEVVPLPRGPDADDAGTVLGGSSLAIPTEAAEPELAFAFMQHLTEDARAVRLAEEEGRLPARLRVFEHPALQAPELEVVVDELRTARVMKLIALPAAEQAFQNAVEDIVLGRRRAAEALELAQRAATGDPSDP